MPIYTYRCQNCRAAFEKTQTFFDKPLTRCPECRMSTMRRIPQLPAIVFKGSGWYSTDHRSSSSRTGTLREKNGKAEESSGEKSER